MRTYKGIFRPKHPEKYKGNVHNIVYRSSWELKMMSFLDNKTSVISWSSEELAIPYRNPIDGSWHRYFPDFLVTKRNKDGSIETNLIEIKPLAQTIVPEKPKKRTRKYLNEVVTFAVNQAKWEAADTYCKKENIKFLIMTEHDLNIAP